MLRLKYLMLCICCFGLSVVRSNAQALVNADNYLKSVRTASFIYAGQMTDDFMFKMPSRQSAMQTSVYKSFPAINHLPGLFCKLEYKLETKSKLAPRFRLGSLAYTEWMEGKQDFFLGYYK